MAENALRQFLPDGAVRAALILRATPSGPDRIGRTTYDALGRMTSEAGPLGTVSYQWDAASRNTRITWPDAYYAQYDYDLTGAMTRRHVPGAGLDEYAGYYLGSGTGSRRFSYYDPLGSAVVFTTEAGTPGVHYAYDEYGVPQSMTGSLFGYAGSLYTAQAGSAPRNMRNRQYHPGLGRFLQTDPIGIAGGVNLYAYVGSDPVNAVDPFGLQEVDPIVVTGTRRQSCTVGLTCERGGPLIDSYGGGQRGGYYGYEDVVDEIEVTGRLEEASECRPGVNRGFWEGIGYAGDALTIFGLLIGNPVVAGIGAGL